MWDFYAPPPKPFYRRPWFLVPASMLLLALAVGLYFFLSFKNEYEAKARQFDLKKLQEMESASTICDRKGNVIGRIFLENRDTIALKELPYELIQAVVAAEDNRFYEHRGVDYHGMARAAVKNWRAGGIKQGASTLTQQLARNTFGLRERTYDRKLVEIFLALEIERHYTKNEILEMYLNRVYFGAGFYGVEAAARGYFGKSARTLNLSESATLCGLLKNPNNRSPWTNRQACVESRNYVLGRMLELGKITPERYNEALAENLAVKNRRQLHTDSYAVDLVRQQVNDLVGLESAYSDGYRIYTTIDLDLQKKAEESLQRQLRQVESRPGYEHQRYAEYDATFKQRAKKPGDENAPGAPEYLQGALVAVDNASGGILALVGGRDFAHSQYDRSRLSLRPAGTAFKPFVYAAALEKGLYLGSVFQDSAIDNRQVMIGGTTGILGEWGPERVDNKYEGAISARYALVKSKNAATVRLGMQTGIDKVIALAKDAGLARVVGKGDGPESLNLRPYPATFLGSSEVTLMDMTLAYTIFPNGGRRPVKPFIITKIEEKDGNVMYQAKPQGKRVIKETTAYEIHSCLSQVLEWGSADDAYSKYGLKKFPLGGKTGTAYNFTDTWFVGYSSAVTCGVWAGFDAPKPIYRGAFSKEIALPVWVDVMNSSFAAHPPRDIAQPAGLKRIQVCRTSGLLATDKCVEQSEDKSTGETIERSTAYFEMATAEQAPKQLCTMHGQSVPIVASAAPSAQPGTEPGAQPGRQQWPRAAVAVDLASVTPVQLKAPTVIGDDPYIPVKSAVAPAVETPDQGDKPVAGVPRADSSKPAPAATPAPDAQTPKTPGEMEVRRAEPVRPGDQPGQSSTIKIDRPAPLQF
jgi:1A family penicillin-binding protein